MYCTILLHDTNTTIKSRIARKTNELNSLNVALSDCESKNNALMCSIRRKAYEQ